MTRALALMLLALPAHAAGNAPPIWDVEGPYRTTVHEVAPDDARSWAILTGWFAGPDVPLPDGFWLLTAAIAALIEKEKCYV